MLGSYYSIKHYEVGHRTIGRNLYQVSLQHHFIELDKKNNNKNKKESTLIEQVLLPSHP